MGTVTVTAEDGGIKGARDSDTVTSVGTVALRDMGTMALRDMEAVTLELKPRLNPCSVLCPQIRYKEEFEKNKGKGFSVVADTPELQRIRKTQDQISNIKYHEEFERSRMGPSPSEGSEPERRNSQESSGYRRAEPQPQQQLGQPGATVFQPPPPSQSFSYPDPAAPASAQRSAPPGGGKRFRAVYDYNAADEDEVSFQDGDTIINVQQIDDGWMYGTVERTGDTGMLPANYVEAI
ncbi:PREDICTED: LIM and SH3 domain protein 1 [Sturnus vulgaris]|uniref:LIM and SH3 domain protein 1 n=1 Tax=Sturnus vulgaris TaxID=9172 RepID=UPI00071A352D|nr:PREDICTED: LIM and SH3 domain protein 1 [Sturnus vulgaris]